MGGMSCSRTGIFRMQLRRAVGSKMTRMAALVLLAFVTIGFVQTCLLFWGHDVGELPSAAFAWAGNSQDMHAMAMSVLTFFLIFLVPASAFADRHFLDVRCRAAGCVATRVSTVRYVVATGAVAFLVAFALVLAALVLAQLLALLAFPPELRLDGYFGSVNDSAANVTRNGTSPDVLFSWLRYNRPYLYNLLYIVYDALWAGIMALASFAISLFTRKSRLVVLGGPTLVYLAWILAGPRGLKLSYYLVPTSYVRGLSEIAFFGMPALVLASVCAAIAWALASKRDVML